jgi:hypothetical protein
VKIGASLVMAHLLSIHSIGFQIISAAADLRRPHSRIDRT